MRNKSEATCDAIIEYIDSYYDKYKTSPTVREIGEGVGVSKSTAHKYVDYLVSNDRLTKDDAHRGVKTKKIFESPNIECRNIAKVGYVSCGMPMLAEENIEKYYPVPEWMMSTNKDYFILSANGNSMINAGIKNGDLVLVRKDDTAKEGDIVVALTEDGETTLKSFYTDDRAKKIVLHPENEDYADIYCDYIVIQGVAERVIKDLI